MKTTTPTDPTSGLFQLSVDYAMTWINTYIKESPVFSDADLNEAEISLMSMFDFPLRHIEVHLPVSIDSEAAAYPDPDHPIDTVRVLVYAADPDDSVMLVLPLGVLS